MISHEPINPICLQHKVHLHDRMEKLPCALTLCIVTWYPKIFIHHILLRGKVLHVYIVVQSESIFLKKNVF